MSTVIQEYGNLKVRGGQVMQGLFKAADIDGDGNLTIDEFMDVRISEHESAVFCHGISIVYRWPYGWNIRKYKL